MPIELYPYHFFKQQHITKTGYKMKIKSFATFLIFFSLQVTAQTSTNSIGIGTGILNLRGNALGGTLLFERKLSDNVVFMFTPGAYFWINSKDMNEISFLEPVENREKVYAKYLIPVRFGLRYNFGSSSSHPFGSSSSHPFGSAELGFNFFEKEKQVYCSADRTDYIRGNYIYASIGFSVGYTFRLDEVLNLDVAVVCHYGDNRQYVNLMSAVKYDL